ncbi:MAG TPA: TRAFs-binding domain-containing protein [Pyrinomonadaceae bacterium]|nr:TRAFs-binding domain-containing protein [Pyrinomonadaceae bacterium]
MSADEKKTCFVVMGFGEKVDLATGRKLNLNASYENLIKPTVEGAGLKCERADEIQHSGNINVPMYERLLTADLVIADLSTSNNNAFYELGVRHALRPYTTIIIAENEFNFPFDIAQIAVRKYKHLGDDIGVSESKRFRGELEAAIKEILSKPKDDSPVYIFLNRLRRLKLPDDMNAGDEIAKAVAAEAAVPTAAVASAADMTHGALMQQVADAKNRGDFLTAKTLLSSVRILMKGGSPDKPEDPYIMQQLALVTYKSKHPTPLKALEEARDLLLTLNPATSNDTETLGLWGSVHKRLWDETKDRAHLDEAVRGHERGFYLRNDYYNGINLAYLLNVRAANANSRAEAIADFVQAERIRREVIGICESAARESGLSADNKYWVLATMAEAYLGVGDEANADKSFQEAAAIASAGWMKDSSKEQMNKLRALLVDSPLKYVKADG